MLDISYIIYKTHSSDRG